MRTSLPVLLLLASLVALAATGCGAGGGGGSPTPTTPGGKTAGSTGGTAFKGPFVAGSPVQIFRVSGGRQGDLIGSGTVGNNGSFNIKLNDAAYSGPLIYSVSGEFASEAAGMGTEFIAPEKPVFGFLPNYAAGTNISNVVVTPLTSLAFQLALFRGLTAVSLQAAANEIGTRFGLSDILHTVPAVPKTSGTADSQAARYGLVLAGLTEQASAKGVATAQLLANLSDDASDGTLDGVATSASFGDYSSAYFTGLLADGVDTYVRSVVGSSGPSSLTSTAQSVKLNLTRALLSIGQLGLPAVGARGQVVTATLKLTNTGGNAALLSNAIVTPSQTGLAVAASVSNATRIEPGSYAILTFTITIDTSAPGGSPSFRIQVDATDAVSAQAAGGVRTDGGILPIQEPSSLSVGNLQTPGTIVPGGSFRVLMPVTNSGGSGARIDSATLFLSQPGFVVTSDAGNSQTVAAGDSVALLFTVVVGTSVRPGTVSIDARVVARDLLTGATGVATRTGAGAIRVLSPARLSIGQVVGSGPLVPGQSIQVSVPVGNVGESVVTIQSVTLGFGSQDLTVSQLSGNPPAISPGITSLFRFRVTAGANTAGRTYTAAATVSGLDSGSNLQVSAANATAGTLVIVRPATLSIQSLGLPAAVSVGQTFTATLSVANTGESTADIGSVAVTFDNPGVNTVSGVSNPGSIQPGRTQNFRVTVLVSSSASSGPVAASVDIRAVDRLSGGNASANAASVATLNVLARAGLAPLSVLMQQLVSKGQTAVATLTVQNGGQAQASITVASLSFSDRNVTSTARSDNPRTVAGNGTAQLAFDVVVGSATPSGVVTIGATVSGRDSNSNAIVGGSIGDAGSTLVQTPGAIQVSTVIGPARLSKGQTFLASATLSSVGEAAVRLSAASLTFSIPLVTAAISSTSPLPTLGQGQSIRLRFAGTVGASAAQGPIAALLEASGKDVNSNATVRDSRAGAYAATIDTTAAVSVTSLTLSTGTVSQGQTFTAVLALSNSGSATAIVTGIAVQFLQAGFVTTTAAPVPITIAGGGSVNATFQIRATTTASGSGTVTMSPTGRDANSGKPLTVAPATSNLLVQTPSRLRVSSLSFSRPTATLTQGQSASITMTLVNDGQAPADVSTVQLVFDPRVISTAGQAANVRIASTPRTFVFAVTASPTQTAVVKIDGDATAIDSNSRASLAVTRGSTLTIVVQRPAALTLDRIDVRRTVTLGQVTPASMVFRNSGEATLTLTQAVVVRNLPFVNLTTFTGLVSIPGGAAVSVTVNMTAVTSGATTLTSATAQAREDNTGRRLTVVNGMALPPTVNVQVAPGIRLEKPLVPKFVSLGQTFSVTAMVANTGEAPLRLIGASIAFRPTNLPSSLRTNLNSLTILGFSTSPVVFNVTVPVTTTAGPFDMDVSATGQDDNTGPPPLPTATRTTAAQLTVQTTPQLSILPLVKQGTASRGRSFTVTIPVRNLGQATARVTAATLVWSRSSVTSALKPGQLLDIPPNTTGTAVAMTVTVASNTPLGAVTSVATVDAIDVNSGSRLPRISFQSSSPTTIQVPAVLSIQSFKGQSKVSQGQSFVVTVGVKDLGVAAARIRNATLVWSPPSVVSVLASPATPTFVNGGSNVTTTTLSFACTVDSAATIGQTAADLAVTANDANDDTFDISVLTTHIGTTLVQTKATPVLASLNSPAFITQGQSIRVALTVNNIGQAKLLLDPPALTLTVAAPRLTASVRPTNPTSIAGNSSAQLFFDLAASATATPGTTNIGAALVGHDENVPGPTINSTNPNIRQITIQRPPQLSLGSLVSVPPHVSQGQQLLLALLVSNPPDAAAATFNGPSLLGSAAGISTVTTPPSPSTVASGQTTNLVFLATVAGTATTGTIFLQGVVPFLDANTLSPTSLSPVIRNPVGQLDVQVGAKLSLGQTGARTAVTQGQGFSATISATNLSGAAGAAATGTVASFQRSDTSFSATLTPPLGTINGAATVNSTLTISTANPGTSVGSKNVVVTFSAHDGNSGQVTQDTVKSITVSFVVQGRPTLLAQSPSVPTSMSQGEIKVPIAVSFSNQTASGAPARITGLSLTFLNGSTDDSIHYTPTFATPLPARVGAGGSLSVPLLVDVSPAAITGTVTVSANILAVDDNDGTSLTVTSPAGSTTTVVGARPVLRIAGPTNALPGIFPAKSKLSTGQAVQFQLQVRNFGAASANITGGGLSFFSGFVNKTGEYSVGLSSGAGTIAASNLGNPTAATLTFNVTPSTGASGFGTISVGGTVTATASVGGANATTSITPPVTGGTFVLQSAVILSSGDIFFDPILPTGVDRASGTTSGDLAFSRVTVRLRVNNANGPSGASLVISAASLNLTTNIASVNADYDIVPPASLPVTVSGNGTAFLSFGLAAKPQAQKAVLVTIQPSITFSDANVGGSSSLTGGSQGWFVRDRASAVFGQTDFSSATATPAAANRFNSPLAAASDGSRLFVADTNNSRVLIYPSLSATSPSTCIGQANFLGGTVNGGLPVGPTTLSIPSGIAVTGTKLIVVDSGNNRALVFNDYRSLPQFGAAADIVVGQADFSGSAANRNAAVGADGMSNPRGAVVIASVLFIADTANNRVLRFDQVPSTNNPTASAAVVIGQPNVTSSNLNQGAAVPGPNTLALPAGLGTDGQRLFIADQGNDRVLVYATSLSANNANADRVLGHTNFVSGTSSKPTTDGGLSRPTGVAAAGDKVYVADTGNNRVVQFFNPNPANFANFINGERALDLLGQARFTENGANNTVSGSRDAFSLSGPGSVVTTSITDATHAIVVDTGNNRVLLVPVP